MPCRLGEGGHRCGRAPFAFLTEAPIFCITGVMKFALCLLALAAASCAAPVRPDAQPGCSEASAAISNATLDELGRRIWNNECAGSVKGLVSWNHGENFPSLGIGHFIWFPAGVEAPFEESFPAFVAFARAQGAEVPSFFRGKPPWRTRTEFLAQADSPRVNAMRSWLAAHVNLQTRFIVQRSRRALRTMLAASTRPGTVERHYRALSQTSCGLYALIDYVNFKGEGVNPAERYRGRGWGLLQVLETMDDANGTAACRSFAKAAASVLKERVRNSPPARGEARWLAGWLNRCRTYAGS